MREIEIKVLGIERKQIEEKLISFGAEKVFDDTIHALYYDTADRRLRHNRLTLRLRREGKRSVLALKADIEDDSAKVREEKEVEVSDFDTMREILGSLGLSVWLEMEKHRTSYKLTDLHFELDKYSGAYAYIPEFLEIEGTDMETIHKYAGMLGFTIEDCLPWDALQVAEYYAGRHDNV